MTLTKRKNTSKLNASSPPFPDVCLRHSLPTARLMVETMVRRSNDNDVENDSASTTTTPHEQFSHVTPRGWNRSRTYSGGLPERKVLDEEDDDDFPTTPNNTFWHYESITPPRTVARVYAASAPRQRKPLRRSPSPSPRRVMEADSWLIPHQHPLKVLWDVCTVFLSVANAYATHMAIRDREFQSPFIRFCEIWFVLDIFLNFCVQRTTSDGTVLRTFRAVWARYLTSWFVVDVLSLFPAELLWVQPIVEAQKRRTFWQKGFFRTKAVVKVMGWLRLQHVRYLSRVSQHTKRAAGIGASRLVRLLIRYAPKYILFIRKTRGVLCVRALRQIRWMRQMYRDFCDSGKPDNATCNLTEDDWWENHNNAADAMADWEVLDDDPF